MNTVEMHWPSPQAKLPEVGGCVMHTSALVWSLLMGFFCHLHALPGAFSISPLACRHSHSCAKLLPVVPRVKVVPKLRQTWLLESFVLH